ncbi:hypothetical protein [Porphyromonas canoris]|uniref:hypothetical protein n=1 Tax=Porphyromonas canoris TaxID=36875 RepID=UPI0005654C4D|nr:hypothetical protein [Porphyromonas canoris]
MEYIKTALPAEPISVSQILAKQSEKKTDTATISCCSVCVCYKPLCREASARSPKLRKRLSWERALLKSDVRKGLFAVGVSIRCRTL